MRKAVSFSSHISKRLAQNIRKSVAVQDVDLVRKVDRCCEKDSFLQCIARCQGPFIRNALKTCLIKFVFALLSTRSIAKTIEQLRYDVPRFGVTFGLAAALFHLAICLLRRLGKRSGTKWPLKMSDVQAYFVAAFACSFPIVFGLQKNELSLVKLVFFPLAFRCITDKLLEAGILPKFVGGDILGYMLVCCFCPYSYMLEYHSCPPAISRMIFTYCDENAWESRSYNILRSVNRVKIASRYL